MVYGNNIGNLNYFRRLVWSKANLITIFIYSHGQTNVHNIHNIIIGWLSVEPFA